MKFSNQNRNRIIALLSMLAAGILIGQIFSTAERTVQAKIQRNWQMRCSDFMCWQTVTVPWIRR